MAFKLIYLINNTPILKLKMLNFAVSPLVPLRCYR